MYQDYHDDFVLVYLDDDFAHWIDEHNKEVHFNNRGYPMIEAFGKMRPLHCVLYYLHHKIWSQQWKTGIHHKDGDKLNCRINNLELISWQSHKEIHNKDRTYWTPPRPKALRIA